MMHTQKFLKANGNNFQKLNEAFGITVKKYDNLVVLNYDQIESPKTDPVVCECRGLIMDYSGNVVSRSFDRFFNLGEATETQSHLDWNDAKIYEKADGSLIKIYHHDGRWEISTRGTAYAESSVHGFDVTFRGLVLRTLGLDEEDFQIRANGLFLDKDTTHIFELTCFENRVVTRYTDDQLVYLGSRDTNGVHFYDTSVMKLGEKVRPAKSFDLATEEDCINAANNLGNLEEGFVVWQNGRPVCKVKSPAYVAVHKIRGDGLTPNRIAELVLTGEEEEYLTYFEEDRVHIEPYTTALKEMLAEIEEVYDNSKDIEEQKEFALKVAGKPYSGALFQARKTKESVIHCFHQMRLNFRIDLLRQRVSSNAV